MPACIVFQAVAFSTPAWEALERFTTTGDGWHNLKQLIDKNFMDFKPIDAGRGKDSARWLQLGVLSLGLAGLFAVLLVLSRMPVAESFFPWVDFFSIELVVHFDKSVMICFLSMAGRVWSL